MTELDYYREKIKELVDMCQDLTSMEVVYSLLLKIEDSLTEG